MEGNFRYTICQSTRQKQGSNIFSIKKKRYAVSTLLKSEEELKKMTKNLSDKKCRRVKVLVRQTSLGSKVEFVEWIK